jgi:hypothetical protein
MYMGWLYYAELLWNISGVSKLRLCLFQAYLKN